MAEPIGILCLFGKKRTSAAATYPPALCRAILLGLQEEVLREAKSIEAFSLEGGDQYGQVQLEAGQEAHEDWEAWESPEDQTCVCSSKARYYDTVTGDVLPENLTQKAREEEIRAMEDWQIGASSSVGGLAGNGEKPEPWQVGRP